MLFKPFSGNSMGTGKKYCVLVFLKDAKPVVPFDIDKTGFGNANAWLTVNTVDSIKK